MEHTDQVIAESVDYLVANFDRAPDLDRLAKRAGYEPTYFQKIFREKMGISPKRLVQYMQVKHAKELLREGNPTLDVAHETGLSGSGRLYDLFVSCEAVTPGDMRFGGRDVVVTYGFHASPLGEIMVAQTELGVCYLGFLMGGERKAPIEKMKRYLPEASYKQDDAAIAPAAEHILRIWRGEGDRKKKLKLDLHGTNMQIQVWQALLKIPCGETLTYGDIAQQIGKPRAARAIGNAVGANPISLLIPCHRVIRATGIIDNYGWGSPRKKLILGLEAEHIPHGIQPRGLAGDPARRLQRAAGK
jgi:AraC family transcriptional regulator, regulatory protein of adaptative response / methylated-DNA-[protein]-cysteine methyltransferase